MSFSSSRVGAAIERNRHLMGGDPHACSLYPAAMMRLALPLLTSTAPSFGYSMPSGLALQRLTTVSSWAEPNEPKNG